MEKSVYNLASRPRVNQKRSRLRILTVAALGLAMTGIAVWQLDGFLAQQRSFRDQATQLRSRQVLAGEKLAAANTLIKGQQAIWKERIDWANGLMNSTAPILSRHFEQLENLLPERVRLESFGFDREDEHALTLSVVAASENDLYELFRCLAGHGLDVASESSVKDGTIRAGLKVRFSAAVEKAP